MGVGACTECAVAHLVRRLAWYRYAHVVRSPGRASPGGAVRESPGRAGPGGAVDDSPGRAGVVCPGGVEVSELQILSLSEMNAAAFDRWHARYCTLRDRVAQAAADGQELGTGLAAVWRLAQKKMAEYAFTQITATQDFVKILCTDEGDTHLPAGTWPRVTLLMTALRPWVILLGETTTHRRLRQVSRMAEMQPTLLPWDSEVVYARVNLFTGDMYVGETDAWARRVATHYRQTMRHAVDAVRPCGGCDEHTKYVMHRAVKPQQWLMVPLITCVDKREGRRIEEMLRRKWKPNMNAEPMTHWRRRVHAQRTYAADKVRRTGTKRTKAWRDKGGTSTRPPITRFTIIQTDKTMYNLYNALSDGADGGELRVCVTLGARECTSWKACQRDYHDTVVFTMGRWRTLAEWRTQMRSPNARGAEEVTMRVRRTSDTEPTRQAQERLLDWMQDLQHRSEEDLRLMWKARGVDKSRKKQVTNALWREYEQRYDGLTRKPIEVRVPYVAGVRIWDIRDAVRQALYTMIGTWPYHIVGWHARNVRIITIKQPSVGDMLINVQKATRQVYSGRCACACAEVCGRMRASNIRVPPLIDGHLCITGREINGNLMPVMGGNSKNVPAPTARDFRTIWCNDVWESLPMAVRQHMQQDAWTLHGEHVMTNACNASSVTTARVGAARKLFKGMVIGPIDKNQGELSVVCPMLYKQTLHKLYATKGGVYQEVHPNKLTAYQKKKHGLDILAHMTVETVTRRYGRGTKQDILNAWRWWYQKRGYHKIAKFDAKGEISQPYGIYKDKNLKPEVRGEKLHKARPITPGCKHPMARILSAVGRAWSFLVRQLPEPSYVLHTTQAAPIAMDQLCANMRHMGKVEYKIMDIEGCFTNMPKETIKQAMRWVMDSVLTHREGSKCITVPRGRRKGCRWGSSTKAGEINVQPDMLMEWILFDLDNAYITMEDGKIAKQTMGIPMGSPLSPAMAIAATAYMEYRWRTKVAKDLPRATGMYDARRYMDDVLFVYTGEQGEQALQHFRRHAYEAPLKLEDAEQDIFLETRIIDGDLTQRRIKNKNEGQQKQVVWKYQRYDSYTPYLQKWAVMMTALVKVHQYATDDMQLLYSARTKLREFEGLGYPSNVLKKACIQMQLRTDNATWTHISQPFEQHQRHQYK